MLDEAGEINRENDAELMKRKCKLSHGMKKLIRDSRLIQMYRNRSPALFVLLLYMNYSTPLSSPSPIDCAVRENQLFPS